jgi:hypothetical protein
VNEGLDATGARRVVVGDHESTAHRDAYDSRPDLRLDEEACDDVPSAFDDLRMTNTEVSPDPETVDAVGKATEALEYVERARGHLYAFHQLIGRADFLFEESARWLAQIGHRDEAASLWHNLVGRDVLAGRWTFEIVEGFDDDYYDTAHAEVMRLEKDLVGGHRHAHEEAMRRRRREENPPFLTDGDG